VIRLLASLHRASERIYSRSVSHKLRPGRATEKHASLTDAIAVLVTSLDDFPLAPDVGVAWLWSGGGDRLLWASAAAKSQMGPDPAPADPALVRSFAPLLALAAPEREPIRVHQLAPGQAPVHTCLCRHVPLRQGGFGLLAVAIGAPARPMDEVRGSAAAELERPPAQDEQVQGEQARQEQPQDEQAQEEQAQEEQAETSIDDDARPASLAPALDEESETDAEPMPEDDASDALARLIAEPEPPSSIAAAAPDWTGEEAGDRSPIRFVWQTDAQGVFVHISRELAAAVGPGQSLVLGRTWEDFAREYCVQEWQGVASGFRSLDSWIAPPALWPVESADLGVPVEMAGLKVLDAGRFDGFRGYGIARIERAVAWPQTAAEALAGDAAEAEAMAGEPAEAREAVSGSVPEALAPAPESAPQPRDLRRGQQRLEAPAVQGQVADPQQAQSSEAETEREPELEQQPEPEAERDPSPPLMMLPAADHEPRAAATAEQSAAEAIESPLSPTEREAFREIAKALGAMTDNLGRTEPPTPEGARDARPLEILQRDIVRLPAPPAAEPTLLKPTTLKPPNPMPLALAPPAPGVTETAALIDLDAARRDGRFRPPPALPPLEAAAPALLDAAPVGLLVVQDGEPVFANRMLLELAGYPDLATLRSEGGLSQLFGPRDAATDGGLGRFDLATRSGGSTPVEASVQPLTWAGAPAALTILRAAAEPAPGPRQRAQEMELRAAQSELRELRSVLDTATDGVILLDGEGRILSLNRSAEALFGYDQNEIAGEKLIVLFDSDSHLAALDYLEGLKSNGVNAILNDGRDVRGRERNGGAIPLFMTIGRVGEREGGAKFCAVLRDVTHWKKVETDLMEAKRAAEDSNAHKSDFLARISHEVRTPLNAIIGFSQVMMSESFGPIGNERYRQYAQDIHASGEHVVSLVNDLLDLSKIAAGRLDLSFGSVDVNAVVAGSVAMIQPQANAGRVIVRSQLAAQLPAVVADERSLRQIMLNLLSNAARYTEAGGQVVASTSLSDRGEVVIRVSDTGVGMAEEEVRRAMEPFRQISGPRSGGGTGLGLPLTKALVEANRAAFSIRSEPRKGTLVEVVFPSTRVLAE